MSDIQLDELDRVESRINYIGRTESRPAYNLYKPEPGTRPPAPPSDKHVIPFYDVHAKMREVEVDLAHNRFYFLQDALPDIDYFDKTIVSNDYNPTCFELVKRASGATRVVAFDHNVRDKSLADRAGVDVPVRFAHNDYTDHSAPQRARDLMPDEATELLTHRYMFINVWRTLLGPVLDAPLAICGASSIDRGDYRATDLKYRNRTGEIFNFQFSAQHRWFFLGQIRADEILMLKCYDSGAEAKYPYTAHCAFCDPRAPEDARPPRCIEVRTIAFFAP